MYLNAKIEWELNIELQTGECYKKTIRFYCIFNELLMNSVYADNIVYNFPVFLNWVIIEKNCKKTIPTRKIPGCTPKCHTFYLTDAYNIYEVPPNVWFVQYTYKKNRWWNT